MGKKERLAKRAGRDTRVVSVAQNGMRIVTNKNSDQKLVIWMARATS